MPFLGPFGTAWDDAIVARWSANPLGHALAGEGCRVRGGRRQRRRASGPAAGGHRCRRVTPQDFNGDIALIACFASSWTPAMVWRWHADPFGFLRPGDELAALLERAPPHDDASTGTGVVVCRWDS